METDPRRARHGTHPLAEQLLQQPRVHLGDRAGGGAGRLVRTARGRARRRRGLHACTPDGAGRPSCRPDRRVWVLRPELERLPGAARSGGRARLDAPFQPRRPAPACGGRSRARSVRTSPGLLHPLQPRGHGPTRVPPAHDRRITASKCNSFLAASGWRCPGSVAAVRARYVAATCFSTGDSWTASAPLGTR